MSKKRIKQYLMLLTVVGLVAVAAGGGNGTFASFSAETTNPGNTFATGTLFLHNQVGAGTICTSESAALNVNGNCSTLFNVTAAEPGQTATQADLTLTNAGSINASGIKFLVPSCADSTPALTTLSAAAAHSAASVTVNALPQALSKGTPITINGDSYTVNADAASAATSISITPGVIPAGGYTGTETVDIDTSGLGAPTLCSQLQFQIVETASNFSTVDGCAFGTGSCTLAGPFTGNALSSLPSSLTSLTLANAVNGNAGTGLDAGKTRYFVVQVFAPLSLTNAAQNAQVKLDLTWHIDQA
jgi:hypothetical protein